MCADALSSGLLAAPTMAAAAGAFSPAFGPAAGPSSGRVFNGLEEASQDALVGIQANGANQASSPMPANPPGTLSMIDAELFDLCSQSSRICMPHATSRCVLEGQALVAHSSACIARSVCLDRQQGHSFH